MKQIICLFVFLLCSFSAMAQSQQDVVYLKNGSVIRGSVIEQVPNASLKIKTADGSVFVYQMDEVDRITKEEVKALDKKALRKQLEETDLAARKANKLEKGYFGLIDYRIVMPFGDYKDTYSMGLSTSHGYMFNPYIYTGVGVAAEFLKAKGADKAEFGIPVFANVRITPLDNYITPVLDVRLGKSFGDIEGTYFDIAAGIFGAQAIGGITTVIGYHLQTREIETINPFTLMPSGKKDVNYGGWYISVGYTF